MPKGTTKKKAHDKLREVEDQLKRGFISQIRGFQLSRKWSVIGLNIKNSISEIQPGPYTKVIPETISVI